MWRTHPRRGWALGALAAVAALALTGAGWSGKKRSDPPPPKVDETISNLAYIAQGSEIKVEGIGLVAGLENTGVDPGPSYYRERLIDEMRKAGVENANKILGDPRFAMVIVRAKIPFGVTTSDRIDAEVELPPASGTSSLASGYLMMTRLRQVMIAGGTVKEDHDLALAQGPVMIGNETRPNDPKVGRVLGGARAKKEIPFSLVIKDGRKSVKTALLLEKVVNARFHQREGVEQKGMAKGQNDQILILRVPRVYHHFPGRYFEVVRRLPVVDTPALRQQRLAVWGQQLLKPESAGVAALSLEGLGPNAIEVLKSGLSSPSAQVRFFAAEALAYLDDSAGAQVLGETATKSQEFRGAALAALAALDQPAAHLTLRKLMDVPDVDLRSGAFTALRTLDPSDPFLGRVRVLDEPPADPDEEGADSMAVSITQASRRRNRVEDPFTLYLVDSEGPPMIHVASTKRCEVVVFGRGQKLLTPVVLGTGSILLNAADGDDKLQISKIVPSQFGDGDQKVATSLELGDVIRQTANLGANYPEIIAILETASRQRNLPGPLVVNAVPVLTPSYIDAVVRGKDVTSKKDEALQKTTLEKEAPKRKSLFNLFRRN